MIECDDLDPHPFAYETFLMCLSVVSPFLNAYAIFCIVKKSTKQMASYKWWLLAHQLTSSAYDFVFTTLTLPVMFFPIVMVYTDSLLARWISLTTVLAIRVYAICLVLVVVTVLNLFIYRCHLLIPENHFLKLSRGSWPISLALLLIFLIPVSIGLIDFLPDQAQARKWVVEEYSCARTVIDEPRIAIANWESIRHFVVTSSVLNIIGVFATTCTISLSFHFLGRKDHMSRKTILMQRRYLISLCIQVSVQVLTFLMPICVFLVVYSLSYPLGQDVGNLGFGFFGLHGLAAPLSLILCNDTYRHYTFNKLKHGWTEHGLLAKAFGERFKAPNVMVTIQTQTQTGTL